MQAFSRRWDMERHLNKSKYGCPANRFSSTGEPLPLLEGGMVGDLHSHDSMEARQVRHFTALHCTALHCIALHFTVLHCTAMWSTWRC